MTRWQLQDAKNKFSELIARSISEGPQVITRHGVEIAVVIPFAKYQQITAPPQRLGDFFLASPLSRSGLELDLERNPSTSLRQIEL
jgi:antitoxin Phd